MNEFYQDLLSPLMYYWVQLHKGVHVCTNSCKLCLTHDSIYGVIYFHENKMVELMIKIPIIIYLIYVLNYMI